MRGISKQTLRQFWEGPPARSDVRRALEAWHREARRASWQSPQEIKRQYASASLLKGGRVVFNLGGNSYRLVVRINFTQQIVFVRFIGTHADYDATDAETV
ncbi:MAG: type II toxin-antitoxin system HigB family toxin [Steroidobacteraceae bacterium]|nr:type II toxin-antitoxin system HigB family toxin [Steroidobacteraceae bacterium]